MLQSLIAMHPVVIPFQLRTTYFYSSAIEMPTTPYSCSPFTLSR